MEQLAFDGRTLEHCSLAVTEVIKSRGEESMDRRRNGDCGEVSHHCPASVLAHEEAVVDQHRDHLLDEQWVAFRGVGDSRLESAGDPVLAHKVRNQLPALDIRERLEQDGRRVQLASCPAGPNLEQLRTRHAEE